MSFRRRLKNKRVPAGFEQIEEVIEDFENQMKEAVNEEHDGLRKNQSSWKIHRLHWEKNRFIFDLMYKRKVMSKELVSLLYSGVEHSATLKLIDQPNHFRRWRWSSV
jgi:bud site selection protein 31